MNHAQRAHALIRTYRHLFKALPRNIRVASSKSQRYAGWCEWDSAKHPHRKFLQRNALGSGYHLTRQLPALVQGAAMQWAAELEIS